ncbi:MAG TPA: hypothetical protein VJR27_05190 [Candidatus Saccharimonadales bacterium]|nr:hypothetical protein [Candidatus Saccharimonadales bacterium]
MKQFIKKSLLIFPAVALLCSLLPAQLVSADFIPGHVIDNAVFDNANSMSAPQIDVFLNNFPGSCISQARGFTFPDPNGYSPNTGYTFGSNVTAGQAIFDAAQAYNINPQVLITTLQKEQGLISGPNGGCTSLVYAGAAGYGCPDGGTTYNYSGVNLYTHNGVTVTDVNGTCVNSSAKVGFSQQLIRAAWLLKFGEQRSEGNVNWAIIRGSWNNSDDPQSCYGGPMTQGTFARCPSGGAAYYDGYVTIDGQALHMDTGATATLYWYTPHLHGNQNFSAIYNQWFGDPTFVCGSNEATMPQIVSLYSPQSYAHFYTGYRCEANAVGFNAHYNYEGAAFNTTDPSIPGAVAIWRLANNQTGDHMWTAYSSEISSLVGRGYHIEGLAFYTAPANAAQLAVWRLYNPQTYQHVWTSSQGVINLITQKGGFRVEGVAFYSQ